MKILTFLKANIINVEAAKGKMLLKMFNDPMSPWDNPFTHAFNIEFAFLLNFQKFEIVYFIFIFILFIYFEMRFF